MKVYEPILRDGHQFVHPLPPDDFDSVRLRFDAHVPGTEWIPRPLELIREDEGKNLLRGDWLYFSHHIPALRPAAALAIKHVLDPGDQLLPMMCGKETLYFLKPKWSIDAVDEAASDLWRDQDGTISYLRKPAFKANAFSGQAIFYVSCMRSSICYLTDRFVDAWNAAGLTGLAPKLLWESP